MGSHWHKQLFTSGAFQLTRRVQKFCVVDTVHIYLLCAQFWFTLVVRRSIVPDLMPWQLVASFVVSFSVTFVVQGFFCLRIQRFGHKNRVTTGIIATTALAQLASGMVFAAHSIVDRSTLAIFEKIPNWSFRIELITSFLCDVMISGSLIYYFYINLGLSKRTETILQKLISLAINQGVLLGLVTIVTFVLFLRTVNTFLAMPSQFILSKLYVNCLLATLNSRKQFREIANQDLTMPTVMVSTHHGIDCRTNVPSS